MRSYVFKVLVEPNKFEDGRDAWHASCPTLKVAILGAIPIKKRS
jgi:hypothetical protein